MKKTLFLLGLSAALILSGCGAVEEEAETPIKESASSVSADANSTADSTVNNDSTIIDTVSSAPDDEGEETESMANTVKSEDPADAVVIVKRYSNMAWGYQDKGSFITLGGDVYSFDFSSEDSSSEPPADFLSALEEIRDSTEPEGTVDSSIMTQCSELSSQIDTGADFPTENIACDAGQSSVYAVCGGELIELCTVGDNIGELKDDAANSILNALEDNSILLTGRTKEAFKKRGFTDYKYKGLLK